MTKDKKQKQQKPYAAPIFITSRPDPKELPLPDDEKLKKLKEQNEK